LNVTRPPFDNPLVRKAFSLAINREEIVNNVLKGGELPATSFVPPGDPNYPSIDAVQFDVDRARALLAEAGYPEGRGLPPVEILYNSSEAHRTIAETVQRMWQEHLHVDARLLNQDWKTYLSSMNTLDYTVARSSWIGDVADAVNFLECFQTDVGNNRTGWSSPEYDALLARASAEPDREKRAALLRQAEILLLDECPIIPVYFYSWKFLKAVELKGFQPNILGYIRWKDLYLDSGGGK
jgi:oligopeptide transport system substrate-binding protein